MARKPEDNPLLLRLGQPAPSDEHEDRGVDGHTEMLLVPPMTDAHIRASLLLTSKPWTPPTEALWDAYMELHLAAIKQRIEQRDRHLSTLGAPNQRRRQKAQADTELERATLVRLIENRPRLEKRSALAKAKAVHGALKVQGLKPRSIDTIRKALPPK
jgi:hypothetical protein